ncbi:hypothetical protein E4T56_gene15660, partial [Termitomyces sp. T112]
DSNGSAIIITIDHTVQNEERSSVPHNSDSRIDSGRRNTRAASPASTSVTVGGRVTAPCPCVATGMPIAMIVGKPGFSPVKRHPESPSSALGIMAYIGALGLTALLFALPGAFEVLRLIGTAYLVYLGIKAWRAPVTDEAEEAVEFERPGLSRWAIYRGGFTIAISNPKALLFAAAFLPQFINPTQPKAIQLSILISTFAVIETFCYFTYAMGGRGLAGWLRRPAAQRWFNRVTGTVFMGFGAMLLRSQ